MKKIKALMFAFVLAGMTVVSCSSDDSGPAASIDGKWNVTKTVVKFSGQSITQPYEDNVAGCDKNYVEFAAASVFNEAVYFKGAGGSGCQTDISSGTWTKTDKTLTINTSGELDGTYEISKLSGSSLELKTDYSEGGITASATVYLTKVK